MPKKEPWYLLEGDVGILALSLKQKPQTIENRGRIQSTTLFCGGCHEETQTVVQILSLSLSLSLSKVFHKHSSFSPHAVPTGGLPFPPIQGTQTFHNHTTANVEKRIGGLIFLRGVLACWGRVRVHSLRRGAPGEGRQSERKINNGGLQANEGPKGNSTTLLACRKVTRQCRHREVENSTEDGDTDQEGGNFHRRAAHGKETARWWQQR